MNDSLINRFKESEFLYPLLESVLTPNLAVNAEKTKQLKLEQLDNMAISRGKVAKGELIVAKSSIITPNVYQKLSSYKEQTFTFDLTVRNNKKEEVQLLLKDQYPLSTDKEISIELLDDGKAKVNAETGILTWDLKLQANETKKIRISYKVRYPKDKVIDNL